MVLLGLGRVYGTEFLAASSELCNAELALRQKAKQVARMRNTCLW